MKPTLLLLGLVSISTLSFSQGNGNNSNWKVDGNNSANGHFLGTTNAQDLIFKTNSTEGLRLDASGNLIVGGVVQGLPLERLTLNGNMIATGTITANGLSVENFVRSEKGVLLQDVLCIEGRDDNTPGSTNRIWSMDGDLFIQSNSAYQFNTILNHDNSGNVGIGTLDPEQKLDVNGNSILRGDVLLPNLSGSQFDASTDKFIFTDENGVMKGGSFDALNQANYQVKECSQNLIDNPYWMNGPSKLFIHCPEVFVGIGTLDPLHKLDVRGNIYFSGAMGLGIEPALSDAQLILKTQANREVGICIDQEVSAPFSYAYKAIVHDETTKGLGIYSELYSKDVFTVYSNGKIEVSNASGKIFQLEPNGLLRGRQIKLDLDNWADFVFEEDYTLMPLSDVESFVKQEKHLPNVPSEKELIEDGLDIEEMNKILMMKVEELTLYLIDQNKSIEELKVKVIELESNK